MKLMKRGNETTHVPDCFISAYRTLGYSVVGEESSAPAAPPQLEQEQDVPDEKKDTEYVCPFCGKPYSRKGNLDKHILKEHREE